MRRAREEHANGKTPPLAGLGASPATEDLWGWILNVPNVVWANGRDAHMSGGTHEGRNSPAALLSLFATCSCLSPGLLSDNAV